MARFNFTVYRLADLADCVSPDTEDSPGAQFLLGVQDAVNEAIEEGRVEGEDYADIAQEIADNSPDVYTYTRWQQFLDLGAWLEDLSDVGGSTGNMTEDAGVALYIIAERLAFVLLEVAITGEEDDDA